MRILIFLILVLTVHLADGQIIKKLPCEHKTFQLVLHHFEETNGNSAYTPVVLDRMIDTANGLFANICFQFETCEIIAHENYRYNTFNIDSHYQELVTLYNQENKINVYLVEEFVQDYLCAFTNIGGLSSLNQEAIVIAPIQNCNVSINYRLAQGLGRFFNLPYTFENGGELANGSNCQTAGDAICDTPADPFLLGSELTPYINNCVFIGTQSDANGFGYSPDIGNVMSHYGCECRFSNEQYRQMQQFYLQTKLGW